MKGHKLKTPNKTMRIGTFGANPKQPKFFLSNSFDLPNPNKNRSASPVQKRLVYTPNSISPRKQRSYTPYTPLNLMTNRFQDKNEFNKEKISDLGFSSWENTPKNSKVISIIN